LYGDVRGGTGTAARTTNLTKGGNGGRVDDAMGNKVLVVLLSSSRPHQDIRIKGLGRRVIVGTMASMNRLGVLDHLIVDVLVGDGVRPPRRVVDVLRIYRLALVRQDVARELVDHLAVMRLGL
jgi:hypothetical protein